MDNLEPYNFFFELPIYTKIKISDDHKASFVSLVDFAGNVDAYSPSLGENTTFKCTRNPNTHSHSLFEIFGGFGTYILECKRTEEQFVYCVHLDNEHNIFQKIGQLPSIADLHINRIKKYDKVLVKEQLREFTRAIGLAANGVGIGSFVYLRRIFEALILEAFGKAKNERQLNDEDFNKLRTVDRIELLKDYLPTFLSENKNLYSILSVGVHSLQENECLAYFETVKIGIELILDEKVEQQQKIAKIEEAKKKLAILNSKISKN